MALIELNNVCLDYVIKTGSDSIKKSVIHLTNSILKREPDKRQALKNSSYRALNDITLSVKQGDRVGILGKNGAGKSTLLRVMAQIYKPNAGTINVEGRTSNLFDVNLGINSEATGYENIVNLGIMRWRSRQKALSIVSDVEEFTELGDFLNQPVRTYSTGMQMKLAFAVATAIPPEIILIDEIIGAGDAQFMDKATRRMKQMIEDSKIMVLTSHSNDIIRRFCNKALVLEKGENLFYGSTEEAIKFYEDSLKK